MIRLEINAPDEALNSNDRLNRYAQAERVRNWKLRAAILARKIEPIQHAHIICTVHFVDNRRRDVGNWYPTAKAAVDGVVKAGVLKDDSDAYVIGPDMRRGDVSPGGLWIELVLDPDCTCVDCHDRFHGEATA